MQEIQSSVFYNKSRRVLYQGDKKINLNEYTSSCLILLMHNENQIVSKEQILQACWGHKGIRVTQSSVRQVIRQLRLALNTFGIPEYALETQSRLGYLLNKGFIINESLPPIAVNAPTVKELLPAKKPLVAEYFIKKYTKRSIDYKLLVVVLISSLILCIFALYITPAYTIHHVKHEVRASEKKAIGDT